MAYERRIKITHTIDDCYKYYKNEYDGSLNKKEYKTIAYELNKTIADMIIRDSFEYRIPYGLGFIRIKKVKLKFRLYNGKIDINKNIIDWKATWDYWEKQYPGKTRAEIKKIPGKQVFFQDNEHTNGDVMRWYWDKRISRVKNILTYSFKPVKGGEGEFYTGRLGLSKWINSREKRNEYYY